MLQVWLITQLRHKRTHGRCAAAARWSSVCMTFQTSIFWIAGMSATHKNHLYHIPSPHIGLNLPPLWGIIKGKEVNNHHNNDNLCTALEQVFTTIMLHFCTIFSISRSTEGTWAIQMSCCHTGPHHVLCVLFQHHCDLQIFLSPKPNISCMSTLINCWALQDIWSIYSVATHNSEVSQCTNDIRRAHADLDGISGMGTVTSWPPCLFHHKICLPLH